MEKFKTVHENKVLINTPIIESLVDKMQVSQLINNMRGYILSLQRYEDEWGYLVKKEDGRWVKIEDVLKLFGAENEIK